MECYKIENLSFSYPQQEKYTLSGISLTIEEGEFITLCGPSGSGKSTFLRQLKTVLAPHGEKSGKIYFEGRDLEEWPDRTQASRIGFVRQSPEYQLVTDKVWHELAFGLESLGLDTADIRRRTAEMAEFFGIESWFHRSVNELSGGQKQILNLASVMVMQPAVLILDEPTSQLDPVAAAEFISVLEKINREIGTTIILSEHRLEDVLPLSHRVIVMEAGQIAFCGTPKDAGKFLREQENSIFHAMPVPMRIHAAVPNTLPCPITVREGRKWLTQYGTEHEINAVSLKSEMDDYLHRETVVHLKEVWFRYEKNGPDVIKDLSLEVKKGEFFCVLGGNGTGKTTLLSLLSGTFRPYRGKVTYPFRADSTNKRRPAALLPQDPKLLFVKKTIREDLLALLQEEHFSPPESDAKLTEVVTLCRLEELLHRHPYDLSGGEQQRAALAKILLANPDILLLDEPTKGLDIGFKQEFAEMIKSLTVRGKTVIMVSHDIEFCASHAERCALFFDGNISAVGKTRDFFSNNTFYSTAANRMARHLLPDAITAEDVIFACGVEKDNFPQRRDPYNQNPFQGLALQKNSDPKPQKRDTGLPLWRKIIASLAGICALITYLHALNVVSFLPFFENGKTNIAICLALSLLCLALSLSRKKGRVGIERKRKKWSKRSIAALVIAAAAMTLTLYVGIRFLGGRKYLFISLLLLLESMLPFFFLFESRKPQAREVILIAVLCALGVAGRAAFFMLPQVKPVLALIIIAGVAFGGETGFLVGALTGLLSNFFFGQGPWTPWQMFCLGIIGFLAGVFFQNGFLYRGKLAISIFGGLSAVIIYGGIMNPVSVLLFQTNINWKMIMASYVSGFPMDIIHGAATMCFLWLLTEPMLEKLDRIKIKYGLVQ